MKIYSIYPIEIYYKLIPIQYHKDIKRNKFLICHMVVLFQATMKFHSQIIYFFIILFLLSKNF